MPKREVDQRKTRKALRKLRRAAARAEGEGGPGLTDWEKEFVDGVTGRLEKYGSAFRDPGKGRLDEALSARQAQVTRVIEKKSRKAKTEAAEGEKPAPPKPRSTFKPKPRKAGGKAGWKPRVRDINDDPEPAPQAPPKLRLVKGGKG